MLPRRSHFSDQLLGRRRDLAHLQDYGRTEERQDGEKPAPQPIRRPGLVAVLDVFEAIGRKQRQQGLRRPAVNMTIPFGALAKHLRAQAYRNAAPTAQYVSDLMTSEAHEAPEIERVRHADD